MLDIRSAEIKRNTITKEQEKRIKKIYEEIGEEVVKIAKTYENKSNISSVVRKYQLMIVRGQIEKMLTNSKKDIKNIIVDSMKKIADEVSGCSVKWLKSVGFDVTNGFTSIKQDVIEDLITGRVYKNGWNLDSRIWGINEKEIEDIYSIVARGIAEQKTTYEITKDLEKYVKPSAKKPWSWSKVYPSTNKVVDYNAQRLARTLSQHAYQQSFVRTTINNPFVLKYRWESNGSRACPLCEDRNGTIYSKNELPEDHPNGMCTWTPICEDDETIIDNIANWYNSEEGTYPEIDAFAKECGYKIN